MLASAGNIYQVYQLCFHFISLSVAFTSASAKMTYIIKYSLGEYFEDTLKADLHHVSFTFKFDKAATTQVNKQYDEYGFLLV